MYVKQSDCHDFIDSCVESKCDIATTRIRYWSKLVRILDDQTRGELICFEATVPESWLRAINCFVFKIHVTSKIHLSLRVGPFRKGFYSKPEQSVIAWGNIEVVFIPKLKFVV